MNDLNMRGGGPVRPNPEKEKPTITETECARRMTVHAARVQLFTAAGLCDATRKELGETLKALNLPVVRRAGEPPPLEESLGAVCLATSEFILQKLESLGLVDAIDPPEAPHKGNGEIPDKPKLVQ